MNPCLNQFKIEKALTHLKSSDEIISSLIEKHGPCTIRPSLDNPFRSLASSIISQQLSAHAARAIKSRLFNLIGDNQFTPGALLNLPEKSLQGVGLSRAKVSYIMGIALAIQDGRLNLSSIKKFEDEVIIKELCKLRGIGRWSAEMFLIFGLGRPDVLSVSDAGLKRAFKLLYRLRSVPSAEEMIAISGSWRPYRSIASWYIWRTLD